MWHEFLWVYWPVFGVLALLSQFLVIYTICFHSPKTLTTLKNVLLLTCFAQIVLAFTSAVTQVRQVSHMNPMELWIYGPVKYLDPFIGYLCFFVIQTSGFLTITLVLTTIFLKYEAARHLNPSKRSIFLKLILIFTPVLVSIGFQIWLTILRFQSPQTDYEAINRDVSEYAVIGLISLTTIPSRGNFLIISSAICCIPVLGLILRRKILRLLKAKIDRVSQFKALQTQIFINGLTVQILLPVICYVPIFMCFFVVVATRKEISLEQYLISVTPVLPAFIDPYITLYFVTPYRRQVKIWLKLDKRENVVVNAVSKIA